MGMAPRGMKAWRRLEGESLKPRARKKASICAMRCSENSSSRPVAAATASRVMSSAVGPMPPVVMTTSERARAWRRTAVRRLRLSPTVVL